MLLTTERLTLRTFRPDDLPLYAALNADPEVYRWLGGKPLTRAWSDEIAEWANECVEAQGYGLVAVERTADGAFLGMCGLHHQESFPDDVEAAWRLARENGGDVRLECLPEEPTRFVLAFPAAREPGQSERKSA